MKKILYITSSRLSSMMVTERWLLSRAFLRAGHIVVDVEKDNVFSFDLPDLVANQKSQIGLIIFEEPIWAYKLNFNIFFKNAKNVKVPKATIVSDYWTHTKQIKQAIKHNDICIIITNHEGSYNYIGRHFSKLIDQILWIPLTIDLRQFEFRTPQKKYDVLLSGTRTYITPFRNRLIDLLEKQPHIKTFNLNHPGHWKKNEHEGITGRAYYKLMAQSHFCLVTSGIFNISSRKYWEISAAGSSILGNSTGLPEMFVVENNILQLHNDMSDKVIVNLINKALDNKSYWNKQAKLAQVAVKQFMSNDAAVKRIENFAGQYVTPDGPDFIKSVGERIVKSFKGFYEKN